MSAGLLRLFQSAALHVGLGDIRAAITRHVDVGEHHVGHVRQPDGAAACPADVVERQAVHRLRGRDVLR